MKVYEAVAHAFVKEGTTTVFGLLGTGNMSWWEAIGRHPGVEIIDARDEGPALTMAEGWAIATGKVGVCSVTHGPGVARLTTSLITATRSRTPVVVHASQIGINAENGQYLDQQRLVSATGAGYIEIPSPDAAERSVRQAFYQARLESRPVVLCQPLSMQDKECDSEGDDYQPAWRLLGAQQRVRPDRDRLREAVAILASSKKPVVIVGRGAMQPAALEAAEQLAKRAGALIATTLIAKGALAGAEYHAGIAGLYSSRGIMQLFEQADCVVALGAGLNARTIAGGYLFPNARIIHVDVAPHVLMGNEKGADCYLQGDAGATAAELKELLDQEGVALKGYRTPEVRAALKVVEKDPAVFEIEPGTVDPREAVRVLDEHLPSNVGLVTGGGHAFDFPVLGMTKPRALHVFVTSFGCIGQTLAAAIGVGVAVRDNPLLHVSGDAGAMQCIQELDTAARLGLKVLFVVLNDEGLGAEYHKLDAKGRDVKIAMLRTPDFGAVGRGFGCRGAIARTLHEIAAGVREFLQGKGPMVLDIRISRNVRSVPYRRLLWGEDV